MGPCRIQQLVCGPSIFCLARSHCLGKSDDQSLGCQFKFYDSQIPKGLFDERLGCDCLSLLYFLKLTTP